jgi:hypothetical protein
MMPMAMASLQTCPVRSDYTVSVDRMSERDWYDVLPLFDDANIYQTWAYGAVHWDRKQLSHVVLRREGNVVAAAQLRVMQVPVVRKGVAYLRWGPLWRRCGCPIEPDVVREMTRAILDEYVERRGLMLRMIPTCHQGDAVAAMIEPLWHQCGLRLDTHVSPYHTFRLNLTPSLDGLRRALDPKWRNKLKGAERNDLSIVEGTGDDLYVDFLDVYDQMMRRKRFETTVDVREFARIQKVLREGQKMRIFLCRRGGCTLNAVVISALGDTGVYLLGATNDQGTKAKGSYLLHWRIIQSLKETGARWYDLGGINPSKNPGVYEFKKGFSGEECAQLGRFASGQRSVSSMVVRFGERLAALRG